MREGRRKEGRKEGGGGGEVQFNSITSFELRRFSSLSLSISSVHDNASAIAVARRPEPRPLSPPPPPPSILLVSGEGHRLIPLPPFLPPSRRR